MIIKQLVSRIAGHRRIIVAMFLALVVAAAGAQEAPTEHILSQDDFTGLATQILTYLGYAVVAGLTILVAVVGARRAWGFMRRFL